MGSAVIGDTLYLVAGWPGIADGTVVMSNQLWGYSTGRGTWRFLGPGQDPGRYDAGNTMWPPKRYCPAVGAYDGKIYLWGGRDTRDKNPQFYNDLWAYDPETGTWENILPRHGTDPKGPSPRYGAGNAVAGDSWFIFGGFGGERGDAPQLNDLWRYRFPAKRWECIFPHNGSKEYGPGASRPGVRRVPAMAAGADGMFLFGGIDLASGIDHQGPTICLNDFWEGSCKKGE